MKKTSDIVEKTKKIVKKHGGDKNTLIAVLQEIQEEFSYLPNASLTAACNALDIPLSRSYEAATFYDHFRFKPRGKYLVEICKGTTCHVQGGVNLLERFEKELDISLGETTNDKLFTLEAVNCLGCCALSPVARIDGHIHPFLTQDEIPGILESYRKQVENVRKITSIYDLKKAGKNGLTSLCPPQVKIIVGMSASGIASGADKVYEALQAAIAMGGLPYILAKTGAMGMDSMEPLVHVIERGKPRLSYAKITPVQVPQLMDQIIKGNIDTIKPIYRTDNEKNIVAEEEIGYLEGSLPGYLQDIPLMDSIPFYKKQMKVVTRNCGVISPENIQEYMARGGYLSLHKAITTMSAGEIIDDVIVSGLRGRGGAGFPAGVKWQGCRDAEGDIKYVICNGSEGDPGAYMDRSIMEGDPHSVIEGMMIGAFAIGAQEGFIYVCNEYPLAVAHLTKAVEDARSHGILGENILGTDFSFDIKIHKGAGAYVSGEATAIMTTLEGKAGEPRSRYIYPVEKGLWDRPSNLNNVETWAHVPVIIARGGKWFSSMGVPNNSGTKVFSVVGKVRHVGLVEVPMGITLKEIVYDICGGMSGKTKLKAVQIGGPPGGCIPASLMDLPVDFDSLGKVGSGIGGMLVLDEKTCMVDLARYFVEFLSSESCGKCVLCREGVRRMSEILKDICAGKGKEEHIDLLKQMSEAIADGSHCALGGSAAKPILSTIKYFKDEYDAHIKAHCCPAGVCKALITDDI